MQPLNTTINGYLVAPCIVTGLEIKHPAKDKKYLYQKDVEFYFKNDPETFKEKLESLLTTRWKKQHENESKKIWFAEIAHKIRCKLSNPRRNPVNNTRNSFKRLEGKGLKLWETKNLMKPEKLELLIR